MAVAYRSIGTTNWASRDGSAWSVTIPKPSGLTVGDEMTALIGTTLDGSTPQSVSGWELLGNNAAHDQDTRIVVYRKTADSSDVAASDFTFAVYSGNGGTNDYINGNIIATSGTAPMTTVDFFDASEDDATASTTCSYSGSVNPRVANQLLIMATLSITTASTAATVDSYSVTTSNPTWTERYDEDTAQSTNYLMGIATASRPESTDTGAYSVTLSHNSFAGCGILLAVIEQTDVTVSPAVVTATANILAPTVTGDANVSPAVVTATANIIAPTVTTAAPKWSNTSKTDTSPSITNTSKT